MVTYRNDATLDLEEHKLCIEYCELSDQYNHIPSGMVAIIEADRLWVSILKRDITHGMYPHSPEVACKISEYKVTIDKHRNKVGV